jgi:archaemetzincin
VVLQLTPLGPVAPGVLESLTGGLPGHLPVQPVVVPTMTIPDGPLRSAAAVDALLRDAPQAGWRLGITERTLLSAEERPIVGEATVGGPAAVISLAPLRGATQELFSRRLLVSALHELGHLAGAEHCPDSTCVMYPSREMAETDAKGPRPCAGCDALIRAFFAGGA